MKFKPDKGTEKVLLKAALLLGEPVIVLLLHKKQMFGKLLGFSVRKKDMNTMPYDIVYFHFLHDDESESVIAHPDILDIQPLPAEQEDERGQ